MNALRTTSLASDLQTTLFELRRLSYHGNFLLHSIDIKTCTSATNSFHVRYIRVLLSLEKSIDLFQSLAFGFDPVDSLSQLKNAPEDVT